MKTIWEKSKLEKINKEREKKKIENHEEGRRKKWLNKIIGKRMYEEKIKIIQEIKKEKYWMEEKKNNKL